MDKTFDFKCELSGCDNFESTGWATPELRDKRAAEHLAEHEQLEPMSELKDFRELHGVEG